LSEFWSFFNPTVVATTLSIAFNVLFNYRKERKHRKALARTFALNIKRDLELITGDEQVHIKDLFMCLNDQDWQLLKTQLFALDLETAMALGNYYNELADFRRRLKAATYSTDLNELAEPLIKAGQEALKTLGVNDLR